MKAPRRLTLQPEQFEVFDAAVQATCRQSITEIAPKLQNFMLKEKALRSGFEAIADSKTADLPHPRYIDFQKMKDPFNLDLELLQLAQDSKDGRPIEIRVRKSAKKIVRKATIDVFFEAGTPVNRAV
jgi:hypothetical protein